MPAHLSDLVRVVSQKTEHRRTYLRYLVERYEFLELKGMGVADRVPLHLPLLDVYVPLVARQELPDGDTWTREQRLAGRPLPPQEAAEVGARLGRPLPVLDLLRHHPGVIVLGDPGAGKTTFLKYLALTLAIQDLPDRSVQATEDLRLGPRLPVLVPLSAYAAALEAKDVRLDDFVVRYYRERGVEVPLRELLNEALARGRALVLLDGLDEVRTADQRHLVVDRVVDFFAAQKKAGNKFVLTSRIVGYREVRPRVAGLADCTLLDFDDGEIERFVDRWTAAIEKAARGATRVAAHEASRERAELLEAIRRNPGVRGLAANPLLLTILAVMKRQGVALPDRRVQLYAQYVETLLRTWNLARGLGRPPSRVLDVEETLKVLAPLALWMRETSPGVGLVTKERLRRKLEEIYREREVEDPEAGARQFLEDVSAHAGVMAERGAGQYGFVHLTFLEYLAAVALAQLAQRGAGAVADAMATRLGEAPWREVCVLTIGQIGIVQKWHEAASAVVGALVEREPGKPGHAVALMGEAVADAAPGGVTPACRGHVVERLLQSMRDDGRVAPAERAACGDALARLGDPRFRADAWYLPAEPLLGFVEIPAGRFRMGSDKSKDRDAADRETPAHDVDLPAYYIGRYPVTVAQFRAFVEDARLEVGDKDCLRGLANHPVVNVSWDEALAYCRWLTAKLRAWAETPEPLATLLRRGEQGGKPWVVTLPSEAEWEKAARGTDGRLYPWGSVFDLNKANGNETAIGRTTAVGCFAGGLSPFGLDEASGNAWEWTRSLLRDYSYVPVDAGNSTESPDPRVLRGGAFDAEPAWLRCAYRPGANPGGRGWSLGFRVVASPFGDNRLKGSGLPAQGSGLRRCAPGNPSSAEARAIVRAPAAREP